MNVIVLSLFLLSAVLPTGVVCSYFSHYSIDDDNINDGFEYRWSTYHAVSSPKNILNMHLLPYLIVPIITLYFIIDIYQSWQIAACCKFDIWMYVFDKFCCSEGLMTVYYDLGYRPCSPKVSGRRETGWMRLAHLVNCSQVWSVGPASLQLTFSSCESNSSYEWNLGKLTFMLSTALLWIGRHRRIRGRFIDSSQDSSWQSEGGVYFKRLHAVFGVVLLTNTQRWTYGRDLDFNKF